ncbi:RHS repeat-associated core domain-containing protein [Streptomyces anatolicus]|uniref:RHS repeat-associated core domain-containing protein n=1 Tax=Streptomyces anatolicus TaxID=2675858 RepID=UPI001CA56F8B|nr:RHS repeat-associated core domain-containing protein [Streptomyces anatolicus]
MALLTRISDRNHNTIDFGYETDGTPAAIRHSGGYHLELTVEDNRVTALSLVSAGENGSDTVIKRYGYTDGNLTTVTNSSGRSLTFTYDQDRRITSWLDTNQSLYSYAYDTQDRCVSQSGESGHLAHTFSYDGTSPEFPGHRITTVIDADGAEARYVTNDSCLVVCEIDPLGNRNSTTYDGNHHVASRTDALGNTTHFVNNEYGQPLRVRRQDAAAIELTYNELSLPIRITLPDGNSWVREYDAKGNCLKVTDPAGSETRYTFDESGGPTSVTDSVGATTRVRSDAAGLPVEVVDPLGNSITYDYDGFGRPVVSTDALGRRTEQGWTVEGRMSRRVAPDGSVETWSYDGEGNCLEHVDPTGAITRYEYSHFDVLVARLEPGGIRHEFSYDSALRLREVRDPMGRTWRYQYDRAGRLTSEFDFDGREVTYDHDAAGSLRSRTNPSGQQIRYERNALGQIVRKEAEGDVSTYSYDAMGNLTEASNSHSSVHLRRDSKGALVAETINGRTITYEYDAMGRHTRRVTPSGAVGEWSYDAVGNRTTLTSSARTMAFTHDPQGREISRTTDASVTVNTTYDVLGRLTDQRVNAPQGRIVQRRSYTYRSDGYPTSIDDQLNGLIRFDHDSMGRILTADAENWSERYAYDDAGNLLAADWPVRHAGQEAVGARTYEGTAISQAGRVRYEYDRAGRITLRQKKRMSRSPDTWHYTWDAEDRLTRAITPDGTEWRYRYDALGRRIAKERLTDGGHIAESTVFTWQGTTLCEQATASPQSGTQITLTWDHVGLRPVAQTETRTVLNAPQDEVDQRFFTIISDLVGTPTELVDENGGIAWRAKRTIWGLTTWNSNATAYTPLRHPGQYFDPESELHYNFFRYYDPETARYLTLDPLGLAPAPNPVTFVHNPHVLSDPLGLAPCREFFTVQSPADAARLRGGGEPWPSSMHRAHFGEGVYSWASRSDAERYFAIKSKRTDELEMVRFTIPEAEFAKLRKADISKMTDDEADAFIDRYSLMSDTGKTDHGYQYITRPTNLGSEHFFDKSVMHLLKFD